MIDLGGESNVMIDLETLDVRARAVILSVGAVRFNESVVLDKIHIFLDVDEQIRMGRTVSGDTFKWWLKQSDSARSRIANTKAEGFTRGLDRLAAFFRASDLVWGNGADFDNALLADAFHSTMFRQPWKHYSNRCYRTAKNLAPQIKAAKPGVEHDALDDALAQAHHLQQIAIHLNQKKEGS